MQDSAHGASERANISWRLRIRSALHRLLRSTQRFSAEDLPAGSDHYIRSTDSANKRQTVISAAHKYCPIEAFSTAMVTVSVSMNVVQPGSGLPLCSCAKSASSASDTAGGALFANITVLDNEEALAKSSCIPVRKHKLGSARQVSHKPHP